MHNLLPQENIKGLQSEYALRVTVVATVFLFLLGVIVCADLFPAYLAAVNQEGVAAAEEQKAKSDAGASSSAAVLSTLRYANNETSMIEALQTTDIHDILSQLVSYRTSGITLTGFSIGQITPGQASAGQPAVNTRPIVLTGIAATREALNDFSQALQAQKNLSGVDVPVSDYSKESDIGFTLNMNLQVQ